jgi:hypothetical protein
VAFGTITAGVFTHTVKLEGSIFNGREPDENRTNFDYAGRSLDSYAGRVSVNPTPHWSVSGSFAYLKSPEGLRPDESIHRVTASALYSGAVGGDGVLAATAVYGANRRSGATESEPSYLLEANLEFLARHSVFGRAELVRKESADLSLPPSVIADAVNVAEIALGYSYDLNSAGPLRLGLGVRGSLNFVPQALEPVYGSRTPTGLAIFLRLRPAHMAAEHDMMKGMPMAAMTERGVR